MRQCARLLGVVMLLVWIAPAALAQTPGEPAIRDTITRQLEAMKHDDGAAAFAIASPAIQTMFGDAMNFMSMVARAYPQVHHSRNHRFLKLDDADGKLVQRVLIESDSGMVVARYEMIEVDGVWRVNGCALEKQEGA